ncbi:MAG TPA: hypothetical protein VN761_02575 [Candidatus Polarisedimenticolia bacterium]|nr:hypothetical protein [Candidatus Polarisedimenticolia bacterium]
MKTRVTSLIAGLTLALTSCAVPHGWKVTHEDVAFRRDSTGAVTEKIECDTHLTHDFYVSSPEGMADKWLEQERYFYLVRGDNSRLLLSCIPPDSNPRFFPAAHGQWLVVWPNDGYLPAYGENLAVALLDTRDMHQKAVVRGSYYLAKAPPSGNLFTPTGRPFQEKNPDADLNYKVDFENGSAILKTYNGNFVFNFSDGTLRPL